MTTEEEKQLGKKAFLEISKQVHFVRDLNIQNFIDRIGYSIVDQVGPTPYEFKFYVIDEVEPNAFAIPGGYIFVTTGLIVLADNDQEIAGVISHETAHVVRRHVAQLIDKTKGIDIASMVAIIAAMAAGRGGAGSQAGAAMAMATAEALSLKYTREIETDADQNGLHYLIKAGYDPNGMINFFKKIHRVSLTMAPKVPQYLLDHPAVENRISLLENLLLMGPKPAGPFKTYEDFKKIRTKTFVEERDPEAAIASFQPLVDAQPKDWEGYYGLGLAYRKMGRLDKSMDALQHAQALAPQDLDISREFGITCFLAGKLDQAIGDFEKIRSASSTDQNRDLSTLYYLGRAYQEKGDFDKALPLLLQVKKEKPDFVDIYSPIGSIYGRIGQKGLSHFYYGKNFRLKGDTGNALMHFKAAVDWLEKGSPEREEAQNEIKELTGTPKDKKLKGDEKSEREIKASRQLAKNF